MPGNEMKADFLNLSPEEQHKVLSIRNKDYSALPGEEQQKIITYIGQGKYQISNLFSQGEIPSSEPEYSTAQKIYLAIKPYVEPTVEMGAMTLGGVTGAPIAPPLGSAVGATLGYGGAKQFFTFLDNMFEVREPKDILGEAQEAGKHLKSGAELALGGEIGGATIKGIVRGAGLLKKMTPALKEKTVQKKAGQELLSQSTDLTENQIIQNIKIAKKIEDKINKAGFKFKFTRGQITNDAQARALERSLIRGGTRFSRGGVEVSGVDLNQEQLAYAQKAFQDYYKAKGVGPGRVKDFVEELTKQRKRLEEVVQVTDDHVLSEVKRLSKIMDEQEIGGKVTGQLKGARKIAKDKATELYSKIPDAPLHTKTLNDDINKLIKTEDSIIEPKTKQMIELVNKHILKEGEPVNIGYQVLRKLRSRIGRNIRAASTGVNPNLEDARQLGMLKDQVEKSMSQIEKVSPGAAKAYRKATKFYAEEYIPKFRQGAIADVLQKGTRGEETKIAMSNISSKFFTKDGIDDYIRAVGKDKLAMDSMKDYARFDMFNKTYNPHTETIDTKKAYAWIHKNSKVLNKLEIKDELSAIARKKHGLDEAQKQLDLFNKSVAGKVLNESPNKMVAKAFGGSSDYGATAKKLMEMVKGNVAAERGLKKAVSEHIIDSSKITAEGFFTEYRVGVAKLTNKIKEYGPALRVLYRNEPKRLRAILDVHKAYKIAQRNVASPIGGGSDTMENFSHIMAAATGARAGQYYLLISIKKAISKYSENQVNKYLLRATFDPDYAVNLINLARKTNKKKSVKQFHNLIATLALYSGKKLKKDESK